MSIKLFSISHCNIELVVEVGVVVEEGCSQVAWGSALPQILQIVVKKKVALVMKKVVTGVEVVVLVTEAWSS